MPKATLFWYLLAAWIIGIALGSFILLSEFWLKLALIPGLILIMLGWRRYPRLVLAGFLMLIFFFGWWRLAAFQSDQTRLGQFADTNFAVTLVGYVDTEPASSVGAAGATQSFIFNTRLVRIAGHTVPQFFSERVSVTAGTTPKVEYGDRLELTGKLKLIEGASPVKSPSSDHGVNKIADWALKEQIYSSLFRPKIESSSLILPWPTRLKLALYRPVFRLKKLFLDGITASLPSPNSGYVSGLLLGTKSALSKNWQQAFATVSLSHVLAVSGYNITIIAQTLMLVLLAWLPRKRAFWLSFGLIIVFTIITGATASVLRAATMGVLLLLGQVIGRIYNPRNAITFAAAVMLFFNPLLLRYDIGFQLSFLATLGIFYLTPLWQKALARIPDPAKSPSGDHGAGWLAGFYSILSTTLGAQLAVLPVILFNFNIFSFASLPANLLVLPFVPITMFFGFWAGVLGGWFNILARVFGLVAWLLSSYQLWVVKVFSVWQAGVFNITLSALGLALIYLLGIALVWYLWRRYKIADNL